MDDIIIITIDPDNHFERIVLEADAILNNVKIQRTQTDKEALNLIQTMQDRHVFITYLIHDLKAYNLSGKYLNYFQNLKKILLVKNNGIEKLPDEIDVNNLIVELS